MIFTFQVSPITIGITSAFFSSIKNCPSIFWVLDLWPDTLVALNIIKKFSVENGFNIETIRSDVFTYLKKIQSKFDIIFSDPPYNLDKKKYIEIINQVFKNKYLKKNGLLIIEHSSKIDFKSTHNFNKSKTYGDTTFTFFENINN